MQIFNVECGFKSNMEILERIDKTQLSLIILSTFGIAIILQGKMPIAVSYNPVGPTTTTPIAKMFKKVNELEEEIEGYSNLTHSERTKNG